MKPTSYSLIALSLYGLLSLVLSWPLPAQITSHVPGIAQWAYDESTFIWNAWYFKHAVVDQQISPLHSEMIWYPLGIGLLLHTYNFYHALVVQPLALAVNFAFASNVALLSSTLFSAYGLFLLITYLLNREQPALPQPANQRSIIFWAALVAGLLYGFASNRSIYAALGHYDMATTQWIPFYVLLLLRSLDTGLSSRQRRKAAALAGFFFALNGLAEMITALFLAIFTLIGLICFLLDNRRNPGSPVVRRSSSPVSLQLLLFSLQSPASSLTLIGLVALLVWGPVLAPILRQFFTDDFSLKGWGEAIPLSVDLLGWFTPTMLHPLWGQEVVEEVRRVQWRALAPDGIGFRDINTVFLGWVSLGLALLAGLVYRRRVRLWLWSSCIFGLFTLGPFLQINGRYQFDLDGVPATFPLPFAILHYLPIIRGNRAPNRNSVLLMLGLAVLVGYAVAWLLAILASNRSQRSFGSGQKPPTTRRWPLNRDHVFRSRHRLPILGGLLGGLILFEHLALPLPLTDARIPAVYQQIAADSRPVSVLQAPLGWRNGFGVYGAEKTLLQYYQIAHAKPILGGNISRAPDFKMDYFKRIDYFRALTEIEFGKAVDPDLLATAYSQADDLAYLYNIGYLVLFPPIPQRYPYADNWQATWAFLKETLPLEAQPFWQENGIEAYRVVQPVGSAQFLLDLGIPGAYPYQGEGWDSAASDTIYDATAIWATEPTSRLFLPLRQIDPLRNYQITLHIHPFAYPGSQPQTLRLAVNGQLLETFTLVDNWQELSWRVPGVALLDGLNRLQLHWGWNAAPRQVIPGSRQVGATGVELPLDAELRGFAEGGWIALFDEQGTQTDASAGRRGVNVTVLDPNSGRLLNQLGFDTTANRFESAKLASFLQELPVGVITLLVTYGDATAFLGDEAITGLHTLGANLTLEQTKGRQWALVGVKGAPPGAAALSIAEESAYLSISLNRDRRPLAAAVDWVEIK
jgi:hypothetical protein